MLPGSRCSCDPLPTLPCFSLPRTGCNASFHPEWGLWGYFWVSPPAPFPPCSVLTLLNAEAAGPLLQGDVLVIVQVASLEEAGGAVLHGDEGGTERGQLGVGEVPAKVTTQSMCCPPASAAIPREGRCSAGCRAQCRARCWPQLSVWFESCPSALPVAATVIEFNDRCLLLQPAVLDTK